MGAFVNMKQHKIIQPRFLPMSLAEMTALGWDRPDILLVSGDAYVDHPSFGIALLGRWLAAHGFRVAILAQPRWEGAGAAEDFSRFPRPRLFAGVSAGAIDSMLAHHTAFRKKRGDDAYTPGGRAGARPNRACIAYTGLLRRAYPGLPVVLGGLEASLRRISHYDFWTDSLRRSILLDSKADLILCGMAEQGLLRAARLADELADELAGELEGGGAGLTGLAGTGSQAAAGGNFAMGERTKPDFFRKAFARACRLLPGAVTAWNPKEFEDPDWLGPDGGEALLLPSHEEMLRDRFGLMRATLELEKQVQQGKFFLRQDSGEGAAARTLLLAPLRPQDEDSGLMDKIYGLPFSRLPHPAYTEAIPAWEMIRTSITTHRGCGGGCSFCSLALHQGRRLRSRGRESILAEAALIASGQTASGQTGPEDQKTSGRKKAGPENPGNRKIPRWAGSISDVGGPSANMWQGACALDADRCVRSSCLHPDICPGFQVNQGRAVELLREISALPGVHHVRVASGVRFDLALREPAALKAYTMDYTGGQLKVAPEHVCDEVLRHMRKPRQQVFEKFLEAFARHSKQAGKEQYVVPYLISAFPGCSEADMRQLKDWLRKRNWSPRQVQCFIPTPGTVATAMFYSGRDEKGREIPIAVSDRDRLRQHHILLD